MILLWYSSSGSSLDLAVGVVTLPNPIQARREEGRKEGALKMPEAAAGGMEVNEDEEQGEKSPTT